MAARQEAPSAVETGEVLAELSRPRLLQDYGSGGALYANCSDMARQVHDLQKGSAVSVTVCENGIWLEVER